MMTVKHSIVIFLASCILMSVNASSDESSQPVLSETQEVSKTENGKVVSPENALKDENEEKEVKDERPDPLAVSPPVGKVPESLALLGDGSYFSKYAFLLDKSTRTLTVWERTDSGLKLVEAHPADMGRRAGDKQVLGDKKTPEGIYFFRTIYEAEMLNFQEYGSRAYTMDYPNVFDKRAKKTGSGIWLHAVPDTKTLYRGSRGCVVVRNQVITPLGKYIQKGKTPIVIEKTVNYISEKEYQSRQAKLSEWVQNWKAAWEAKDLDNYIARYSEEFKSLGMNKDQWRTFKADLNKKYDFIKVDVAKPSILIHEDQMVIRFLQGYASNVNSDFGEKVLYAKKDSSGQFKIIDERWSALPQRLVALLGKNQTTQNF